MTPTFKIGMIVFPEGQIRPQLYMIADLMGKIADLTPMSFGADQTQWPATDLRRYRIRTSDEVSWDERMVRVGRLLNPFTDDYFIYEVTTESGETGEVPEHDLKVHEGALAPDPAEMLSQFDFAPWNLVDARARLLDSYFCSTAKSLGIVGYNGARMLPIPHQINAARYALEFGRVRFLLADEVGLGKTIEAGLIASTLRKYFPSWQTAIFTPESLTAQWAFEMYGKFGKLIFCLDEEELDEDDPGVILPHHRAPHFARHHHPEILIVDEAHQVLRNSEILDAFLEMSRHAHAVLFLTATPVSHDSRNLMRLLQLLDPDQFGELNDVEKLRDLQHRQGLIEKVLTAIRAETPDHDAVVRAWQETEIEDDEITAHIELAGDDNLGRHELHRLATLIVDRYYPGARIIRYRRKYLAEDNDLPIRIVSPVEYKPMQEELDVVGRLYAWLELLRHGGLEKDRVAHQVAAALIQATHSSPLALMDWVKLRQGRLEDREGVTADPVRLVLRSRETLPPLPGEEELLAEMERYAEVWLQQSRAVDATLRPLANTPRFKAFLSFLKETLEEDPNAHILVFTSFESNVHPLYLLVRKTLGEVAEVMEMYGVQSRIERERNAFEFQEVSSGSILISDELGGEGRNFQFASHVVHFDLPLAPWIVEQRIGRCDRVGREEELDVDSQVLVAKGGLDEAFFDFLADGIGVFNESIAPVEAELDAIMVRVLENCINNGATGVLDMMATTQDFLEEARDRENADLELRGKIGVMEARKVSAHLKDEAELQALQANVINYARLFDSMVDEKEDGCAVITVGEFHSLHGMPGVLPEMIGYFDRRLAVRHERREFFSPGHPFIRSMALATLIDSPDRCALVRRKGIDEVALMCNFRISLPQDFILLVKELPVDLRPPLLSRSASLFPTRMLRMVVNLDGGVIPIIRDNELYYADRCESDESLVGAGDISDHLPSDWTRVVIHAAAHAQQSAEEVSDQWIADNRHEFEDLVCEVFTRVNPTHELVEPQIEAIMESISLLTVELDSIVGLIPDKALE
ncbi:MAG: hypothetical protein JJU11_10710 [Candidatus Sumerlaeia bacterium]|nr:hypothetical protein [Candidatus Sumerlaeia bacterium]